MTHETKTAFPWLYRGLWGALVAWLKVPNTPPRLPKEEGEELTAFHPAPGYLRYKKIGFWIGALIMGLVFFVGIIVLTVAIPPLGLLLAIPALLLYGWMTLTSYVSMYLEYDTTWYLAGPYSLGVRQGVWVNKETIVTYDNIQNVSVSQGPIQRSFGIADVKVETAGSVGGGGNNQPAVAAGVTLRGLANAEAVKSLIQSRTDASNTSGLGDEDDDLPTPTQGWSPAHIALLKEVRDAARAL